MTAPVLRAMVTGASAGLGEVFARRLAERGVELVLVARRQERLQALADELPVDVEVLAADLTDRSQLARVESRLAAAERPVDLLVNNAGFGAFGPSAELSAEVQTSLVEVNSIVPVRLARALLPGLLERGRGGIITVGSMAGFQPNPHGAAYGATKAFVHSYSQALHEELRGSGVHAMLVAPGITATEFQTVADVPPEALPDAAFGAPEPVVDAALAAFARGDAVCVPGAANRVLAACSRFAPAGLVRRVSAFVHRRYLR